MRAWVSTDDEGRVCASVTNEKYARGMTEVEVDDGFDFSKQMDYKLVEGAMVFDGAWSEQVAEQEKEQQEQAERAQKLETATQEFFLDGGKDSMEQDIKDAAASGGSDPAVASFMTLSMPMVAPTAKDSALAPVMKYAPKYVTSGHDYKKGEVFSYGGTFWRVSQDFTSQEQWKPGGAGLDALFYEIQIAEDGVIVWAQPRGEFDAPDTGDLRHYPDAEGPVYRSLIDGNSYSPDTYPQGWELTE